MQKQEVIFEVAFNENIFITSKELLMKIKLYFVLLYAAQGIASAPTSSSSASSSSESTQQLTPRTQKVVNELREPTMPWHQYRTSVRQAMANGIDVNSIVHPEQFYSPLYRATARCVKMGPGHEEYHFTMDLLDGGSDATACDPETGDPLLVYASDERVVKKFLEKGAGKLVPKHSAAILTRMIEDDRSPSLIPLYAQHNLDANQLNQKGFPPLAFLAYAALQRNKDERELVKRYEESKSIGGRNLHRHNYVNSEDRTEKNEFCYFAGCPDYDWLRIHHSECADELNGPEKRYKFSEYVQPLLQAGASLDTEFKQETWYTEKDGKREFQDFTSRRALETDKELKACIDKK